VSELAKLHVASGKVREIYSFGDEMLLVASDRISAFDVIMPTEIPDKGRVLTALSKFWFDRTTSIVPNHLISIEPKDFPSAARDPELAGRSMLVRRLAMLPVECVVRGYLAGSGWKDYQATGAICGHGLPAGLRESDRLPQPIFTPATKAAEGHDINIDREAASLLVGGDRYDDLERISLDLYEAAAAHALERGIIVADTKFEFGLLPDGTLVLGDEVLTPDSSRFWPADGYEPGRAQASFDKQYLRDWLETLDWDKSPPGPELPDTVVEGTRSRYADAYQRLTGESFSAYLQRMGA
jgi:phosphoribosylaminoimidazole-succinocarboxamide synthase